MNKSIKIINLVYLILLILFILMIIVINGCISQRDKKYAKNINPLFCNTDSDCKIKDIHNCCGYYPKCVNKEHVPDIAEVERECEEKGISSICGFPDITSCMCVEHVCKSMQGNSVV